MTDAHAHSIRREGPRDEARARGAGVTTWCAAPAGCWWRGASRGDILGLIVRQGMTLTVLGTAVGLVGAVAASQALVTLLFGVTRLDPVTYAGVVVLLMVVSGVACWVPAWRAARIDPAITLRAE